MFDDGQFIERFWLTMATTLAFLTTTHTEQRMRRRSKTRSTNLTSDYPAIKSDLKSIAILIWSALVKQKLVDPIGWPRILIQVKLDLDWWNAPLVVTRFQCCCGRCKGCAPPHWTQFGADPCWQAIWTDPPGQYRSSCLCGVFIQCIF